MVEIGALVIAGTIAAFEEGPLAAAIAAGRNGDVPVVVVVDEVFVAKDVLIVGVVDKAEVEAVVVIVTFVAVAVGAKPTVIVDWISFYSKG